MRKMTRAVSGEEAARLYYFETGEIAADSCRDL